MIKRDGGGVADVQAFHAGAHGQAGAFVAAFAGEAAHAFALGPEHEGQFLRQADIGQLLSGFAFEADDPPARGLQFAHGAGEVGDGDALDEIERAAGGFRHHRCFGGGVIFRGDDGNGIVGRGGAQNGPDIMWVADLVKDEDRPTGLLHRGDILDHKRLEGTHLCRDALMHRFGPEQLVEGARLHDVGRG